MQLSESSYKLIKTNRKTLEIQIKPNNELVIRVPKRMSEEEIYRFVKSKEGWIQKHLHNNAESQREEAERLSEEEIKALADAAAQVIPERVRYYAPLVGVTYGRITIRNQKTRWGSCSAKGNLNFNCLLMLAPPEVLDSVVVHELCHRKEMNHSQRFYKEVYRVFPEYDKWHDWLKKNGSHLISVGGRRT